MGASSETELDSWVQKMNVSGRESEIKCPVLLTVGEYDSRSPIELIYDFYQNINAPKELWVYEDNYHQATLFHGDSTRLDCHMMCMDWLCEALNGKFTPGYERNVYLRSGGGGPSGRQGEQQDALHWWE